MVVRRGLAVACLLAVLACVPRPASAQSTAEVVIEWNRILQASLAVPGALPPTVFFTRPFAVLHVAMFDALNSIDYRYSPQIVRARAEATASRGTM